MARLLDLYCGAGGSADGYVQAGFEVVGYDIEPQPHYPYDFVQQDVLDCGWAADLDEYDVIHASPPCQAYTELAQQNGRDYPDLIGQTRELLRSTGKPYIIENVDTAPLIDPIKLCGTMFLGLRVLRHRLFETNFYVPQPAHPKHPHVFTYDKRKPHYGKLDQNTSFVQVTGGGNCTVANALDAMGMPPGRMSKLEVNEAIPPAYAEFVGRWAMIAAMVRLSVEAISG